MKALLTARNLLLLDMFGASVTAIFTLVLLATEIVPTGLPTRILFGLSAAAAGFALIDAFAFRHCKNLSLPLAVIGFLNLMYCGSVGILTWWFSPQMTYLGITYFALESAIVVPLALLELNVASMLKSDTHLREKTQP
jgi:hypothetical protein